MKKHINAAAFFVLTAVIALAAARQVRCQEGERKTDDIVVVPVSYTSESLRDPFETYVIEEAVPVPINQVPEDEEVVLPELKVAGITWGSSFSQAIVNEKVVREGDMIGDIKIVKIAKEGLVFLYRNKQFIVPAPGSNSLKKPEPGAIDVTEGRKREIGVSRFGR